MLERKIRRYRPQVVALVGVTLYRAIRAAARRRDRTLPRTHADRAGPAAETIHGARVFVLPNPSGRNANFTYAEMLAAFKQLARA